MGNSISDFGTHQPSFRDMAVDDVIEGRLRGHIVQSMQHPSGRGLIDVVLEVEDEREYFDPNGTSYREPWRTRHAVTVTREDWELLMRITQSQYQMSSGPEFEISVDTN